MQYLSDIVINELKLQTKKRINSIVDVIENEEHKNKILKFWNDFVVNYIITLASIDDSIKKGIVEPSTVCNTVFLETEKVLKEGDQLEKFINNSEIMKKLKTIFRISGAPYGLQSQFVKHALEKPGGYAGDYEILEFIYNNKPNSEGFGYCADVTFLADDYAKAVRNRKDKMKKFLKNFLETNPAEAKILNIACGSSRDLRELFSEVPFIFTGKIEFTLIDKSLEALNYSQKYLCNNSNSVQFNYYNHSVYDYLKNSKHFKKLLEGQDIVYSIGLADYIPENSLSDLINFFYKIVKPYGKIIIAHKDSKNYHPLTSDWWADWTFYLRNKDEVISIIKKSGISNYKLTVEQEDDTNIIFFIIIQKNSE